jgi:hypothetical protein
MKLKNLLNESQHLSYKRMNIGEEENEKGMTNEEKKAFLEAVSSYRQLGEMISHKGDLQEIHENIKKIVESASSLTLKETGDWFDKVTVNRHMKSMNESYKIFSNSIKEVVTLQQRMESAYDEIGEVLGKYYEIKEGNEFGAERAKAIAKGEDEFEVGGKTFKVTNVDDEDKENAEKFANESIKAGTSMKLKNILNESFGFGDLPSSKLIKMKKSLKEIEEEDSVNEASASAKKLLQSIVDGQTSRIEGIKMSKEMAQAFLDWQRTSPFGKKYGGLPFNRLFTAAFNWGLHRHADKKSKEYKELEAKAKQMANDRRSESMNEATDKETLNLIHVGLGKPNSMPNPVNVYRTWRSIQKKHKLADKAFADYLTTYFKKDYELARKFYTSESISEGASTEEKRIVMMAIKKIAKYRNVPLDYAVGDVIRAGQELERDIQKGKVK